MMCIVYDVFESLAKRVKKKIKSTSNLPAITCAASLAQHRLLGCVYSMLLKDVDLTSVPAEHLASLVSRVTGYVTISNVSGCDLVTILDSVRSKKMEISRQSLDSEETQALVRAMESGVEEVRLNGGVTLEIRNLIEYSGQGKCSRVVCYDDTKDRYVEQLRTWATSRNYTMTCELDGYFVIERI